MRSLIERLNPSNEEFDSTRRKFVQAISAGAVLGAAKVARAQLPMGSQTVAWRAVEPLHMFQTSGPEYDALLFSLLTDQGEVYNGNIALDGTPMEEPVPVQQGSWGQLKSMFSEGGVSRRSAAKAVARSITGTPATLGTLRLYAPNGFLTFEKTFPLLSEGRTDLGDILMFTDRANDIGGSTFGIYNIPGTIDNEIDLEIEQLVAGTNALPGDGRMGIAQGQKTFYVDANDPNATPAMIALAQQIASEYAGNTATHDFSSLPDPIVVQSYTGTSPVNPNDSTTFDFDLIFAPNTDPEITGKNGTNEITPRYIKINTDLNTAQGFRVEVKKAYNLTGNFTGDEQSVTDSMRRTIRTYQVLASGNNSAIIDMTPYKNSDKEPFV